MTPGLQGARLHPYQVAFAGRGTAGADGLVAAVARELASEYLVARAQVDGDGAAVVSHRSATAAATGAFYAARFAFRAPGAVEECVLALLGDDLVLSQGPAAPDVPMVLLLDADGGGGVTSEPVATVGTGAGLRDAGVPHFGPADAAGVAAAVRDHLLALAKRRPLHGLVLVGGRSSRMGRPKWALDFHGMPQARYLHDLLSAYCDRVFLAIAPDQCKEAELTALPHLVDRFLGMGPAGGMLTAMTAFPEAAWLVLACDLPFVDHGTITGLLQWRRALRFATCYLDTDDGRPEPLCTLYEPKARFRLLQQAALGRPRPREFLANARVGIVGRSAGRALVNVNSPDAYLEAVACLRAGGAR